MMTLLMIAPVLLELPLAPPPSVYQTAPTLDTYLRINAGLVTTTDSDGPDEDIEFDEGWLAAVAFGKRMTSGASNLNFDLELEGLYDDQDVGDHGALNAVDELTVAALMVNGQFDFGITQSISLYAGAGIGAAWLDPGTRSDSFNSFDEEDGPFLAWQAKAGLNWSLTPTMALTTGYRFLNIDDAEVVVDLGGASFDLQTRQHVLEVGLRFGF